MKKHSWFMAAIMAAFAMMCMSAFAGTIPHDLKMSDPQKAYLAPPSAMFTAGPVMKTVGQAAVPASHGTVALIGIASPGYAFDIAKASLREPHAVGNSAIMLGGIILCGKTAGTIYISDCRATAHTDYRDNWRPINDGRTVSNLQTPSERSTASYAQAPGYRLNGFKVSYQSGPGGPDNDGIVLASRESSPGLCLL